MKFLFKTIERAVAAQLTDYLDEHNLRSPAYSLSSITTPKHLVECTMQIGISSTVIEVIDEGGLLDLLNNIHLVLLGFKESLFDLNQDETLISSLLRV